MAQTVLFPSAEIPVPAVPDLPWHDFMQLIRVIEAAVSKEEKATMTVRNLDRITIRYDQILTEAQAINRLKTALQTASAGWGLTPQEATSLLALLQVLRG